MRQLITIIAALLLVGAATACDQETRAGDDGATSAVPSAPSAGFDQQQLAEGDDYDKEDDDDDDDNDDDADTGTEEPEFTEEHGDEDDEPDTGTDEPQPEFAGGEDDEDDSDTGTDEPEEDEESGKFARRR